ncbi:response regulator transcription factor [Psychroserpens sp. SPM9]|uniref:response regulator transcription factor n=1 Tax=Psychroserpens sp. SPM9 TaxID=2975598 RepID=UPI0021A4145C|nr:response regulator transcription factor [Psychroserpens sp. SPM9]MDG5490642.1 response regulator transcription factor [Psychroserpens sp. SPM9]
MTKKINVLIVEDEPLIINVLENALNQISETNVFDFRVKSVINCDLANEEIQNALKSHPIDLILLDISIPASSDNKLLSGVDIGIKTKELFPNVKTIVFTSDSNNYKLNNILKTLNPEGFLIKSDIDYIKLVDSINAVINNEPYYSNFIIQLMRRHISNDFTLDKIDRTLLYEISKGTQMKDITQIIHLSKSAVEYRKRNLKQLFEVKNANDTLLISKAKEYGFI